MAELPFDAGEVSGLEKGTVFGGILKANSKQPNLCFQYVLLMFSKFIVFLTME